ncbi:MAG: hypothetical protein IH899_19555 [Planctomycetes bacterium]|nr:hypothetical protein [Planctomycetota bacterium]
MGKRSFGGNRGTNYGFTPDAWGDKRDFYKDANANILVGALLEDQGSIDNIDDILAVDGIHHFGIGPNDFAQGLGYPGEPDHPKVVSAMEEVNAIIHKAGRKTRDDVMRGTWVKSMLIDSARKLKIEN